MSIVFRDFGTTYLAAPLTASGLTLTVDAATWLPTLAAGDHFYLVLQKYADRSYVEIVKCTATAGNVLTIVRGQSGTLARSFTVGDYAELRLTVDGFSEFVAQGISGKMDKIGGDFSGLVRFLGPSAPRLDIVRTSDSVAVGIAVDYSASEGHRTLIGGATGSNAVTPSILLRPNGYGSGTGQMKIDSVGNVDAWHVSVRAAQKTDPGAVVRYDTLLSYVPATRAVNGHALNTDFSITANEVFSAGPQVNANAQFRATDFQYRQADGAYGLRLAVSGGIGYLQSGKVDASLAEQKLLLSGWMGNPLTVFKVLSDAELIHRKAGVDYKLFSEAYLPSLAALGAYPLAGGPLLGPLNVKNPSSADPFSVDHLFSSVGHNAQGLSGYKSGAPTSRIWGLGVCAIDAAPEYAYFGFGSSPWANGLKVRASGSEFNHPLTVDVTAGAAIILKYASGDGATVRGMEGAVNDWYMGRANSAGDVALYSYKHANGIVIRDEYVEFVKQPRHGLSGYLFASKALGTEDLNTLSSLAAVGVYYQISTSQATSVRNYPTQEAGSLLITGGPSGVIQEYTSYSTGRKFVRGKVVSGDNFLPWNEIDGPSHHISTRTFGTLNIAVNSAGTLVPAVTDSALGISLAGSGTFTVPKAGKYKLSFGFTVEPTTVAQNCIADLVVNAVIVRSGLVYAYSAATTDAYIMTTSSYEGVLTLNAGDTLSIRLRTVNNTTAKIYNAGYIMIEEM